MSLTSLNISIGVSAGRDSICNLRKHFFDSFRRQNLFISQSLRLLLPLVVSDEFERELNKVFFIFTELYGIRVHETQSRLEKFDDYVQEKCIELSRKY